MSDNENKAKVDPKWTNFNEMKKYAKDVANNAVQLELTQDEIFNEYFATFKPSEEVVDCLNLTNAFINYTHDNSLLEATKKFTEELKVKWEKVNEGNTINEETILDNTMVSETTNPHKTNVSGEKQLTFFPTEVDDGKAKKIAELKKKMKPFKIEYDTTLSLEENQKVFDDLKKASDGEKKLTKQVEDLKGKMDELYLEYDESKSYDENKVIYDKAVDKSANPSYTFPFKIYFKGCDIRQLDHIFKENHQYTIKEICELMFRHGYKEYAGEVKLVYEQEENMFVPDFSSQRHG